MKNTTNNYTDGKTVQNQVKSKEKFMYLEVISW